MNRGVSAVIVGIVGFGLGAAVQRWYDSSRPAPQPVTQAAKPPVEVAPAAVAVAKRITVPAEQFEREPTWAYGYDAPPKPGETAPPPAAQARNAPAAVDPEQAKPRRIDGSPASYSFLDVRDGHNVIDWFPNDHPPMPNVVKHGPARMGDTARGCGSCHLPTGKGRPENAPTAGLPAAYILRQIHDFRSGLRYTSDPRKSNTNLMIELAKSMTEEELNAAAGYFSSLEWSPWIRVVETKLVPKTRIAGGMFHATETARTEPIAGRIIEVPENDEQVEKYRNPHVGFVAYVPTGSIKAGEALVTTGGMRIVGNQIVQGKTTACGTCHGADLMGVGDVPPIAGRSPSYIVRQMWDIQSGTRNGASAQLMKLVVANLTKDDMVSIAAYVASRVPPPHAPTAAATQTVAQR